MKLELTDSQSLAITKQTLKAKKVAILEEINHLSKGDILDSKDKLLALTKEYNAIQVLLRTF